MMQMIPKWKISIQQASAPSLVLFISDPFLSNVLRKLADIQFQHEPSAVAIARVVDDHQTTSDNIAGLGQTVRGGQWA